MPEILCEIIELDNDVVATLPEYKGRCILVIAKVTEHNPDKYWLHCYNCHVLARITNHTVQIKDGNASIRASILCPKCQEHYFVTVGRVNCCN